MITLEPKMFLTRPEAVSYRDGLLLSGATGELEIKPHNDQWMVKVWQEGEEPVELPRPAKDATKRVKRFKDR